jgi:hypothetical protein
VGIFGVALFADTPVFSGYFDPALQGLCWLGQSLC